MTGAALKGKCRATARDQKSEKESCDRGKGGNEKLRLKGRKNGERLGSNPPEQWSILESREVAQKENC